MNEQYFQVYVEQATPACDANCPNLQINVDDNDYYAVDSKSSYYKNRRIRCVNDTWCRQLYAGMEKKLKNS